MRTLLAVALACIVTSCGERAPTATAPDASTAKVAGAVTEKRKPEDPRYPPGCVSSCKIEGQNGLKECLRTGGNETFCKDYWGNYWHGCVSERCAP